MARKDNEEVKNQTTTVDESKDDGWNDGETNRDEKQNDDMPTLNELGEQSQEAREDFAEADENVANSVEQAKQDAANNHAASIAQA